MSNTFILTFEPLDVWIFKDHKPFDAGNHSFGGGGHLPTPATMYGCIRTALMTEYGADFTRRPGFGLNDAAKSWLGDGTRPGTLSISGPVLVRNRSAGGELFFPAPLDLPRPFRVASSPFVGWEAEPRPYLPWPKKPESNHKDRSERCVYSSERISEYLRGRHLDHDRFGYPDIPLNDLYQGELRVGIARDAGTQTATDHLLYQVWALRFGEGVGLQVQVDAPSSDQARHIRSLQGRSLPLGGKSRRARVEVREGHLNLPVTPPREGRMRVVLVSPLIPGDVPIPAGLGRLTCLVGDRCLPAGGFDFAWRRPKPLRPMLPPGTVIDFDEVTDPNAWETWRLGQDEADSRAGYGLALKGGWNL